MKKIKLAFVVSFLMVLAHCLTFCSQNSENAPEVVEESNEENFNNGEEKEADKYVEAYLENLYIISVSKHAQTKAITPEVKQLAITLLKAHLKMNDDIRIFAASNNISLPENLTEDQEKYFNGLVAKTGINYDKEFIRMMKDQHKSAIIFYGQLKEHGNNLEMSTWASTTLAQINAHYNMVKQMEDLIRDRK